LTHRNLYFAGQAKEKEKHKVKIDLLESSSSIRLEIDANKDIFLQLIANAIIEI
jgi:hypothetical protein